MNPFQQQVQLLDGIELPFDTFGYRRFCGQLQGFSEEGTQLFFQGFLSLCFLSLCFSFPAFMLPGSSPLGFLIPSLPAPGFQSSGIPALLSFSAPQDLRLHAQAKLPLDRKSVV